MASLHNVNHPLSKDTPLHLLVKGKLQQLEDLMKVGKIPPALRSEIKKKIELDQRDLSFVVRVLLDNGCDPAALNKEGLNVTDTILEDVYKKARNPQNKWSLLDYVEILYHLLSSEQNKAVVESLLARKHKQSKFMALFKHLLSFKDEQLLPDTTRCLFMEFRDLHESSAKCMLTHILEVFPTPAWAPHHGFLHQCLAAVLHGISEKCFKALFFDQDVRTLLLRALQDCPTFVSVLEQVAPPRGGSLLHFYVEHGAADMVASLLQHDAFRSRINVRDSSGRSAVFYCQQGVVLEPLLRENDLDLYVIDDRGHSVLTYLLEWKAYSIVHTILQRFPNIDLNHRVRNGHNVLYFYFANLHECHKSDNVLELLQLLLDSQTPVDINYRDECKRPVIHTILSKLTDEHHHYLLYCQAILLVIKNQHFTGDQLDGDRYSALHYAIPAINVCPLEHMDKVKDILNILIDQCGSGVSGLLNLAICALTQEEARKRHLEDVIERLLEQEGVDVNQRDEEDQTPLMLAVIKQSASTVQLLMAAHKIQVNSVDRHGRTAASYAFHTSEEVLLMLLTSPDINLDTSDVNGKTLLHIAAEERKEKVLKALALHENSNLMLEDVDGNCPLFSAILNGCAQDTILCMLESDKFDIAFHNKNNISVVDMLMDKGLLEAGSALCEAVTGKLTAAVTSSTWSLALFDVVMKLEVVGDLSDSRGVTSLMFAVQHGLCLTTVTRILTCSPQSLRAVDHRGNSPLHYSLHNDAFRSLLLLHRHADVNLRNRENRSPLVAALLTAPPDVVRQLLNHPTFDILHPEDDQGTTALHIFMASPRRGDQDVQTMLAHKLVQHVQASSWSLQLINMFLLIRCADADCRDMQGDAALTYAVKERHWDHARRLVDELKVDVNVIDSNGQAPLFIAISQMASSPTENPDLQDEIELTFVKALLQHPHVNVNASCGIETPLSKAIEQENDELISGLLQNETLALSAPLEDDSSTSTSENPLLRKKSKTLRHCHSAYDTSSRRYDQPGQRASYHDFTSLPSGWLTPCQDSFPPCNYASYQRLLLTKYVLQKRDLHLFVTMIKHPTFDINTADDPSNLDSIHSGPTLLHSVIRLRWTEALEVLVDEEDLQVDVEDEDSDTPLFLAVIEDLPPKSVKSLLDHPNCNPLYENDFSQTIENILEKRNVNSRVEALIKGRIRKSKEEAENSAKFSQLMKDVSSLVYKYKENQHNKPLSSSEKSEVDFFLHTCLAGIQRVGSCAGRELEHHRKLLSQRGFLLEELMPDSRLLAQLIQAGVLDDDQEELITSRGTRVEKCRALVKILMQRGADDYSAFLHALRAARQGHIVDRLEGGDQVEIVEGTGQLEYVSSGDPPTVNHGIDTVQ